jgi:predicted ATPase/class 3 adenylate cyclase
MRALPSGTVTFLFTDIEGSTKLLHELGADYADALAEHRRALREAFAAHDGVEVDTQGDAFFVAFARATDALAAATAGQEALAPGPIRVRMGVHTGEPVVTDEGYVGLDVHRAARIAAVGHGGQVLVSQATRDLAGEEDLRDLGEHRLKDLTAPERLYQLGDAAFPPLKSLYRTNLPVPATPFLGRVGELDTLQSLLARDDVRMLTLTGSGGSGKTRLALQAAGANADAYPQGVWWVPLASVENARDVLTATARALGGHESPAELIGDRRLLLLLDNFEHVVTAAADVGELLASCHRLDVLVTSRERLRIAGEQVYPVPVLERSDARELFVNRARAASPEFEPDDRIDECCERLDDLPLALELAAARTSLLTTGQLVDRLGERLDLLRGGRDAETRQRTLRATIEWSYDLLTLEEQRLLAALSVFRGGWTPESAERVCGTDIDLLESLLDKSLLRRFEAGRLGMLETIREFSAERLEPAERDQLLRRLLTVLTELAAGLNLRPDATAPPQIDAAQRERPNVEVALEWAAVAGEAAAGLRLLLELEMYWVTNDPLAARERLDALLAAAREDVEPGLLAGGLRLRGATYDMSGEPERAEAPYEQALAMFEALGDGNEVEHLRHRIAMSTYHQGDLERASRLAAEALERDRRRGDRRDEAIALNILAMVAFGQGDPEQGLRLALESASVAEATGFTWWRAVTLLAAAECLVAGADPAAARPVYLEGLAGLVSVQDRVNLPIALAAGAAIAALRGDAERAGVLWGALEAVGEREPKSTTEQALVEYRPYVERVSGSDFERGCADGRMRSLDEACDYALSADVSAALPRL